MNITVTRSPDPLDLRIAGPLTANLAQAASTYDLCTASGGDVVIEKILLLVSVAGATFTSVSFQTNDTTVLSILDALGVASVTLGKSLTTTWTQAQPQALRSGKKIQYTIVGSTGTGTIQAYVWYRPLASGAVLS
jgi:hypothetical protein